MRWDSTRPSSGEKRVVTSFLVFPKTLQGEARWLEVAARVQVYTNYTKAMKGGYVEAIGWRDLAWADTFTGLYA